jgi:FADH2 O2-dependent halogenase
MTGHEDVDLVVLGAGFAGSLMALVARRIGLRVVLLEKGRHPRFAIGESSTPVANLVLEGLARKYELPRLLPLTKFGSWQAHYPQLACGLKRGFTFVRHEPDCPFTPRADHGNELLVTASPNDQVGDTHWFREDFDHFVLREVLEAGIPYHDQTEILSLEHEGGWGVRGRHAGQDVSVRAAFFIDATGPASLLAGTLGIDTTPEGVCTNSWSVFNHFRDVGLWEDVYRRQGGSAGDHPYRCDDAALHHVLDEGWVWVLRFNNGVTSAGVMFDGERRPPDTRRPPEVEWAALLARYPSLASQFEKARPVRPWVRTGRVQRRARQAAGADWAMLAHSAYFLDPLLSSGNAHSLLTIERLGRILAEHWGRPSLAEALGAYNTSVLNESRFLDQLVHGCYRSFRRFDALTAYTMYYFAGAIHSEERRRQGLNGEEDGFLFSRNDSFRSAVAEGYKRLRDLTSQTFSPPSREDFMRQVGQAIEPWNSTGLCDVSKRNMYPY